MKASRFQTKSAATVLVLLATFQAPRLARAEEASGTPAAGAASEYSEIQLVQGAVDGLAIEKAVNTCLYFGDLKKGTPSLVQEILSRMNGHELPANFRKQIKPRLSELSLLASTERTSMASSVEDAGGQPLLLSPRGLASLGMADVGDLNAHGGVGTGPKILGIQARLHPSRSGTQEMAIEYYPSEDARGEDKPVRLMARLPYPFAQEVRVDRAPGSESSANARASKVRNLTLRIPRASGDFFMVDDHGIRIMKSVVVDTTDYVNCLREQF